MRISDEIDALEVMCDPDVRLPRVHPGGRCTSSASSRCTCSASSPASPPRRSSVTQYFGLAGGIYDHYFRLYLPAIDIFYSPSRRRLRLRRQPHPLLLRLLRQGRPRRRRRRGRPGHPPLHRHRRRAEPPALTALLGRRQHREDRGLMPWQPRQRPVPSPGASAATDRAGLTTSSAAGDAHDPQHQDPGRREPARLLPDRGHVQLGRPGPAASSDVKAHGLDIGRVRNVKTRRRTRPRPDGHRRSAAGSRGRTADPGDQPGPGDGQGDDPAEDPVRREVHRHRPGPHRGERALPPATRDLLKENDDRRVRARAGPRRPLSAAQGGGAWELTTVLDELARRGRRHPRSTG